MSNICENESLVPREDGNWNIIFTGRVQRIEINHFVTLQGIPVPDHNSQEGGGVTGP